MAPKSIELGFELLGIYDDHIMFRITCGSNSVYWNVDLGEFYYYWMMKRQNMDSIKITTGIKRIHIIRDDDVETDISFNPGDALFAEKFYAIYKEFMQKQEEYDAKSKELDAHKNEVDENGIPVNIDQGIAFLSEVCMFMREKIDLLFGVGTSEKVFGTAQSIDAINQFFGGITPFISKARSEKISKHVGGNANKVLK